MDFKTGSEADFYLKLDGLDVNLVCQAIGQPRKIVIIHGGRVLQENRYNPANFKTSLSLKHRISCEVDWSKYLCIVRGLNGGKRVIPLDSEIVERRTNICDGKLNYIML